MAHHANTAQALEAFHEARRNGYVSDMDPNVEMLRIERFRLVTNTIPRQIRSALNAAVKSGLLGRLAKDGHKPEAYFHPSFDYLAREARNNHAQNIENVSRAFFTTGAPL